MAHNIIPAIDRFWSKVRKTDACWEWIGSVTATGYGRFKGTDRVEWVHRFAYRELVGPIPDGLHIDHLCRNRRCVRPDHLEPVPCHENLRRGLGNQHKHRTSCHAGHPYSDATIRWWGPEGKWRVCRICERIKNKRRRMRRHP